MAINLSSSLGCSRLAIPRPISIDQLLAEMRSLRWRQPGPFRTARADGYPGRSTIEDPFLHRIWSDWLLGHAAWHIPIPQLVLAHRRRVGEAL